MKTEELNNDMLIADVLLRLKTLEDILVNKGIFTVEEYNESMSNVATLIAKSILEKAKVPGNLDEILDSIKSANKK